MNEKMPLQFKDAVARWETADLNVRTALDGYEAAPNAVNRLAIGMAWAAMAAPLEELGGWAALHRGSVATEISARALAIWEGHYERVKSAGLT